MSKAAQLCRWKQWTKHYIIHITHTHTSHHKWVRLEENRVKTGYGWGQYGRGPALDGWEQYERGLADGGWGLYWRRLYGRGQNGSMGTVRELDKPNQYHARNVDAMTMEVNIYPWGGWKVKVVKRTRIRTPRKTRILYSKQLQEVMNEVLRTVKICKHKTCETSRRDHPCNCARYERPNPLCQILETTPIVPDMRDHTHCARCVQLSMQPCIHQVPNQPAMPCHAV